MAWNRAPGHGIPRGAPGPFPRRRSRKVDLFCPGPRRTMPLLTETPLRSWWITLPLWLGRATRPHVDPALVAPGSPSAEPERESGPRGGAPAPAGARTARPRLGDRARSPRVATSGRGARGASGDRAAPTSRPLEDDDVLPDLPGRPRLACVPRRRGAGFELREAHALRRNALPRHRPFRARTADPRRHPDRIVWERAPGAFGPAERRRLPPHPRSTDHPGRRQATASSRGSHVR